MPVIERLGAEDALARVNSVLGSKAKDAHVNHGSVDIHCEPSDLVAVVTTLRDDPTLSLRFFTFLSAVDRTEFGGDDSDQAGGLEVLVHLYGPDNAAHATVHVPVDLGQPVCPSITGVFAGANWHEREAHEMFGIDFDGHPGLTPLYLSEDFEGHPGLRSFKLPGRAIKDWPGAKDPEEAAAGGH